MFYTIEEIGANLKYLSRPEELVLLVLYQMKGDAYGNSIRKELSEITGKYWSTGSVYVPLDRLENKGYVKSQIGEVTPERGGRAKRCYEITKDGLERLADLQNVHNSLWDKMPDLSSGEDY